MSRAREVRASVCWWRRRVRVSCAVAVLTGALVVSGCGGWSAPQERPPAAAAGTVEKAAAAAAADLLDGEAGRGALSGRLSDATVVALTDRAEDPRFAGPLLAALGPRGLAGAVPDAVHALAEGGHGPGRLDGAAARRHQVVAAALGRVLVTGTGGDDIGGVPTKRWVREYLGLTRAEAHRPVTSLLQAALDGVGGADLVVPAALSAPLLAEVVGLLPARPPGSHESFDGNPLHAYLPTAAQVDTAVRALSGDRVAAQQALLSPGRSRVRLSVQARTLLARASTREDLDPEALSSLLATAGTPGSPETAWPAAAFTMALVREAGLAPVDPQRVPLPDAADAGVRRLLGTWVDAVNWQTQPYEAAGTPYPAAKGNVYGFAPVFDEEELRAVMGQVFTAEQAADYTVVSTERLMADFAAGGPDGMTDVARQMGAAVDRGLDTTNQLTLQSHVDAVAAAERQRRLAETFAVVNGEYLAAHQSTEDQVDMLKADGAGVDADLVHAAIRRRLTEATIALGYVDPTDPANGVEPDLRSRFVPAPPGWVLTDSPLVNEYGVAVPHDPVRDLDRLGNVGGVVSAFRDGLGVSADPLVP